MNVATIGRWHVNREDGSLFGEGGRPIAHGRQFVSPAHERLVMLSPCLLAATSQLTDVEEALKIDPDMAPTQRKMLLAKREDAIERMRELRTIVEHGWSRGRGKRQG